MHKKLTQFRILFGFKLMEDNVSLINHHGSYHGNKHMIPEGNTYKDEYINHYRAHSMG